MEIIDTHVGASDAFTVTLERDPLLRSTIVAIALFDHAPAWDVLVDRIERATRLTPTFRQRLTPAPLGLAPPRWTTDPDFDLFFHLRRIAAPSPGDLSAVVEVARTIGMAAFDTARPLWEFTLVDSMDDGRAALVMKVHHALTDGIGGIQLAAHVVDLEPTPAEQGPMPPAPEPTPRGPLEPWRDLVAYDLLHATRTLRDTLAHAPGMTMSTLRDPVGAVRRTAATTAALARFVRPVTSTRSSVMTERRLQWHYSAFDVELAALKESAALADGTLNDGFIGAITSGLRRYHQLHGRDDDSLRLTMPISVRRDDDPEGGNHITLVRFEVPLDIDDPVARMRDIDQRCVALRRDRALPYSNAVASMLNMLPSSITAGMLKHVDFLASNVPGFPAPVYVGGAQLIGFYPFGPTLGSAANVTLMSYRGVCHIGVTTDAGAVPDPSLLTECLADGFEEILALAGDHQPVAIVAR